MLISSVAYINYGPERSPNRPLSLSSRCPGELSRLGLALPLPSRTRSAETKAVARSHPSKPQKRNSNFTSRHRKKLAIAAWYHDPLLLACARGIAIAAAADADGRTANADPVADADVAAQSIVNAAARASEGAGSRGEGRLGAGWMGRRWGGRSFVPAAASRLMMVRTCRALGRVA